jgi:hypothetical protein
MSKIIFLIAIMLASAFVIVILYGQLKWRRGTVILRTRMRESQKIIALKAFDERELDGLPAPVRRYFRAVLKPNSELIKKANFKHSGYFNMNAVKPQWRKFKSDQEIVMSPPGFDWDGRIAIMPGLFVNVHDAYVAGEGILNARLLGMFSVANIYNRSELAQGELMRYLGEAVWYPTALLPSQGVHWEAIDESTARATLMDSNTLVKLDFHFGIDDLVDRIHADARPRTLNGSTINTPWNIRVWNYQWHDGVRVPMEGEVAWVLPDGPYPYWRGRVEHLCYEFLTW